MRKKTSPDVFKLLAKLQNTLINKPPFAQMAKEVQMMRFKIKPLAGDISLVDFNNFQLIEILWGLGKLDDFFQHQYKKIPPQERELFDQVLMQMKMRLEVELGKAVNKQPVNFPQLLELEIFKDSPRKKN